jgi:hypothetical protein
MKLKVHGATLEITKWSKRHRKAAWSDGDAASTRRNVGSVLAPLPVCGSVSCCFSGTEVITGAELARSYRPTWDSLRSVAATTAVYVVIRDAIASFQHPRDIVNRPVAYWSN